MTDISISLFAASLAGQPGVKRVVIERGSRLVAHKGLLGSVSVTHEFDVLVEPEDSAFAPSSAVTLRAWGDDRVASATVADDAPHWLAKAVRFVMVASR